MANLWEQLMGATRELQEYERMRQGAQPSNPLDAIFGQRYGVYQDDGSLGLPPGAVAAQSDIPPEGTYEQGIQVTGNRGQPAPPAQPMLTDPSKYLLDSPVSLRNDSWAEEAYAANQANEKNPNLQRKGMFGMKGTLREVLGTLGDAFLVQGGGQAVYAPQRQRERMADALAGHTQAPRAAVERVTQYDPEFGVKMMGSIANQEVAAENARRLAEKEALARRTKGIGMLAQVAGAANPETYSRFREIMQKNIIEPYGLGDEYALPEAYDENYMRSLQYSGMPPASQENVRLGEERIGLTRDRNETLERQGDARIGIAARNAATAERRAAKAGSRGSNPTEAGEIARIRRQVNSGKPLSAGDNQTWQRYLNGSRGGGGGRGGGSSRPSQGNRAPVKFQGWSSKPRN